MLKAGRMLLFRDGSAQSVDSQRQATGWRMTNAQGTAMAILVIIVMLGAFWFLITHALAA
jgi:hypothetical protein